MNIIKICPACGSLAIEVELITVKSMLKDNLKAEVDNGKEWHICSGDKCEITYFSNNKKFSKNDIRVLVWYKEQTHEVPICYCSNLTEKEIFDAVKKGCKTIEDVQDYTNKNITETARQKIL